MFSVLVPVVPKVAPPGPSCGFLGEPANYPLLLKPVVLHLVPTGI